MKTYVIDAKRSAIGSYLGSLKDSHPADVGAKVLEAMISNCNIDPGKIDEVIIGNVLPAGQGQGVARQVSIKANIPEHVPAYSLNMVCGSGLKSVMNAFTNIRANIGDLYVAGGVEHMSRAPFTTPASIRSGHKLGPIKQEDHIIHDALTDAFTGIHMGITAENIAEKYDISREEQDEFALKSQEKAMVAIDTKRFVDEIVPIEVKLGREQIVFDTDEYVNRKTNMDKLSKLRPAFKKDGSVTAGNASGINDGASMLILASENMVDQMNIEPLCEIIAIGQGGVDPNYMGLGPIPAIRSALKMADLKLSDIDLIELNEAFAAQSIGVVKELAGEHHVDYDFLLERTNVNGGAIALGHPVGSSGNRILVTLIHEMKKRDLKYGLASLCIGGGMGTAIIIKR